MYTYITTILLLVF